jgi:NIMA (never in mitosis gene a)-related kinase
MGGGLNDSISKVKCSNPSAQGMVFIEKRFGKKLFEAGVPPLEVQILQQIQDHDHITKMVDHFLDGSIPAGAVYMEYCDVGSLADVAEGVAQGFYVNEHKIWNWFHQVATALAYCHRGPKPDMSDDEIFQSGWSRIYHRDIKPGNILLTIMNGHVVAKLADFGYAVTEDILALERSRGHAIMQPGGTPGFDAPEMPFFSGASDIWQLGLSILCVCTGIKTPWSKSMPKGQIWDEGRPAGPRYSFELSEVLKKCLEKSFARRVEVNSLLVLVVTNYQAIKAKVPTDKSPTMVFDSITNDGKEKSPPRYRRPIRHFTRYEGPLGPRNAGNHRRLQPGIPVDMIPFYGAGYHGDEYGEESRGW